MKYAFIHAHATTWHVTTMCRVLEVSKAGYCQWRATHCIKCVGAADITYVPSREFAPLPRDATCFRN